MISAAPAATTSALTVEAAIRTLPESAWPVAASFEPLSVAGSSVAGGSATVKGKAARAALRPELVSTTVTVCTPGAINAGMGTSSVKSKSGPVVDTGEPATATSSKRMEYEPLLGPTLSPVTVTVVPGAGVWFTSMMPVIRLIPTPLPLPEPLPLANVTDPLHAPEPALETGPE